VYEIEITAEGLGHLNKLPDKYATRHWSPFFGPIAANPIRLDKLLIGALGGLRLARRGDYRIICEIFEDDQIVLIHRMQHRRDA
jgi:mRNA-degrading endonuclease RelE of RelBE toxin-antitoxin system